MKNALPITRRENFAEWYQAVVRGADLAETSPVRGCMVIKPWGYGVWERIQQDLDRRLKETGHENCYFPLFIPASFIAREAKHVEGFAKEMAVVTHHRLKEIEGKLQPDPDSVLQEPLIVRPTSETIIGDAFRRWIRSYRDLPLLVNQWCNVVRWEMRTRMFLRTTEFLWHEGHGAHADRDGAMAETMRILHLYRAFVEGALAMPVIAGEKTETERFPGADNTYSLEAMMQDGRALQACTSHNLGTHFAEAQNIRYQTYNGAEALCFTTSYGASTRLIGAIIMTHGDDDGLRLPPAIAPHQVVVVPIARGGPEDADVVRSAVALARELREAAAVLGAPVRAHVDERPVRAVEKRWSWIRRGAPVIVEIGPRDVSSGQVTFLRRDRVRTQDGRPALATKDRAGFVRSAGTLLGEVQSTLFAEAETRRDSLTVRDIGDARSLADYFGSDTPGADVKGWVFVPWSRPAGTDLAEIQALLTKHSLTIRNVPLEQPGSFGKCLFTGQPAVEEILIARAY